MSISISSRVWTSSRTVIASHRLMLLAIADFANERGEAWPSVGTLAARCCVGERRAVRIIGELCESGELQRTVGAGPHGANIYRVLVGAGCAPGAQAAPGLGATSPGAEARGGAQATLASAAGGDGAQVQAPPAYAPPKPSLNRQEPLEVSLARPTTTKVPKCPYAEIVACYHDALPELPAVKLLDSKGRKDKITEFWKWVFTSAKVDGTKRATTTEEGLAWIAAYFKRARSNDFLMGRGHRSEGHSTWVCDFDFLLTDKGKKQVIEKTREAA